MTVDSANQVWFGSRMGLNFSTGRSEVAITKKPIITKIEIDNKAISVTPSELKVNRHSIIRVEFISLEMPGNDIVYRTKFKRNNETWSEESTENHLLLHNLSIGEYTLHIKARQHGNYDWSEVTTYSFSVVPDWYETWWAYIMYFVAFILLFTMFNVLYHKRLIAQKKHLEHNVKLRTNEIMSKNKELQYLNATKDKFFNIIAHDLKNPFSSILGLTELLILHFNEYNQEKKKELLVLVNASTKDTYNLLENLLSWARSQTNEIQFKPEKINLAALLKHSVEISAAAIHSKNIEMVYKIDPHIEVKADRNMLTTVVRNLIMNAIKYSYRNNSIIVEGVRGENYVKVSVTDHGVGIEPDRVKELFEISEKVSEPGTENEKGTGLGLILCKEFVEKHGGIIDVKSVKGEGSTFWFQIPV